MEKGVLHYLRGYRLGLFAGLVALAALVLSLVLRGMGSVAAASDGGPGAAAGLGQLSGLLPRENLVLESALQVDLTHETVRLPLYKGTANGHTVWFILTEASDLGLAKNSGLNYAPKLANIAIGCPDCVQTVTQDSPAADQNKFGPAVIHFQGEPDFSPTRTLVPGPHGFPPASRSPGRPTTVAMTSLALLGSGSLGSSTDRPAPTIVRPRASSIWSSMAMPRKTHQPATPR